jgi:hypothetical protein
MRQTQPTATSVRWLSGAVMTGFPHTLHCCRYSLCMHMLIGLKWLTLWNILFVVATKFTTHTCCRIWFEKLENTKCLFCPETMSTCAALAERKGINFQWGFIEDGVKKNIYWLVHHNLLSHSCFSIFCTILYILTFVNFAHFLVDCLTCHGKNPARGSFSNKCHSNISWNSTLVDLYSE